MIVVYDFESYGADADFRVTAWLSQHKKSFWRQCPDHPVPSEIKEHMTHLIITGGPHKSSDVGDHVIDDIRCWQNLPILGICLGCMAIVKACGGKLNNFGQSPERIGIHCAGAMGMPPEFPATSAHREKITETGPSLKSIMWSGGEVVGVEHLDKPIYGVMFHPESSKTTCGDLLLSFFLELK